MSEDPKEVLSIAEFVEIVPEEKIFTTAISTAFDTHCRAVDAYFISTAKITRSILITNAMIKLWQKMPVIVELKLIFWLRILIELYAV